jgi:hypothetical protein
MRSTRWSLTLSFLSAAVFVIALLFLTLLGGQRIGFLYGGVAGFSTVRSLAQWAGSLAALGLVVAAAMVTVSIALRPGNWLRKVLSVLPVLLLPFAVGGFVATIMGIGTISNLASLPVIGPVTFASGWLTLGALLAGLALVLAVATVSPGARVRRAATTTLGLSALAATVAGLAIVAAVVIAATNQPSLPAFGRQSGEAGSQGGGRCGRAAVVASSSPAARAALAAGATWLPHASSSLRPARWRWPEPWAWFSAA